MGHYLSHGTIPFMDLSIVVPAFKQAKTICRDLRTLNRLLQTIHQSYEIIVVVDGDSDGTTSLIVHDPELPNIQIITLDENRGKGYAIKKGLSYTTGNIVGFIDAGGDIEYSCIPLMMNLMQFSGADIVIGSKRHPLSQVHYPFLRHAYSVGYQLLNRFLFHLNIRDTQVGAKLFKKEVISNILPRIQIDRFAFDLELLVHARSFGYTHIVESPVHITHKFNSTISLFAVCKTLYDTLTLFYRTHQNSDPIKMSPGISVSFISSPTHKKSQEYSR